MAELETLQIGSVPAPCTCYGDDAMDAITEKENGNSKESNEKEDNWKKESHLLIDSANANKDIRKGCKKNKICNLCSLPYTKPLIIAFVFSVILYVFIFVFGLVLPTTYGILFSIKKKAATLYDDLEYLLPEVTIIVFHTLFFAFFLVVSFLLMMLSFGKLYKKGKLVLYSFIAFTVVMWAGLCFTSIFSKEIKATEKIYQQNETYIAIDDIKNLKPYYGYGYEAYHYEQRTEHRTDSNGNSYTETVKYKVVTHYYYEEEYAKYWVDTIEPVIVPKTLEVLLVKTKAQLSWDEKSWQYITATNELMRESCAGLDKYCNLLFYSGIHDLPGLFMFASDNAPREINNLIAKIAAIFWQGLTYSLMIASNAPTKIMDVIKYASFYNIPTNIVINEPDQILKFGQ